MRTGELLFIDHDLQLVNWIAFSNLWYVSVSTNNISLKRKFDALWMCLQICQPLMKDVTSSVYYKQTLFTLILLMLTEEKDMLLGVVGIMWFMFKWKILLTLAILTHSQPMFHFCTPWKYQNIGGFLKFSGGTEVKHCWKWVNVLSQSILFQEKDIESKVPFSKVYSV